MREVIGVDIVPELVEEGRKRGTVTFAVFLLTEAALGDRLGRKKTFMAGIALFTEPRPRRRSRPRPTG